MVEREGASGPVDLSIIGGEEEATRAVRRIEDAGVTDLALFDASGEGEERERTWAFIEAIAGSGARRLAEMSVMFSGMTDRPATRSGQRRRPRY